MHLKILFIVRSVLRKANYNIKNQRKRSVGEIESHYYRVLQMNLQQWVIRVRLFARLCARPKRDAASRHLKAFIVGDSTDDLLIDDSKEENIPPVITSPSADIMPRSWRYFFFRVLIFPLAL
jgi:hypothetical protein